ncbi:hypothetical protein C6382_05095 [Pseudomonas sp. BBP2017]|nr:hypothetical protein C6382_05095 [Pseudomonas sp. BBP2017]
MNVYIERHPRLDRWWVHLDVWEVSFRSLDEATDFVDRLNTRLNAPHSLSMLARMPSTRPTFTYSHPNDPLALPGSSRDVVEVRDA